MSSCIVLQQQDKIFIGADSAISCKIGDKYLRVSNKAEKTFQKDNYIVFCSGDMKTATTISNYIKNMNKVSIKEIKEYARSLSIEDIFEIFLAKCDTNIMTYQLSSYNNFKETIRIAKKDETLLLALGFNSEVVMNTAKKYINNSDGNIEEIFLNTFNDNICNEIGGEIKLFYYLNREISNRIIYINDNITPIKELIKKKCDFITAKFLVGEIILGKTLYITNDNGQQFYIGNIKNKTPDNTGTDFGLQVRDHMGGRERIFLGIEGGIAKLRLWGDDGGICLDETGILQSSQQSFWNNVSPNYPLKTHIILDNGVSRVSKANLTVRLGQYRGFTKDVTTSSTTTTSGPSSITTSGSSSSSTSGSSSSSTTSSVDSHRHKMFELAPSFSDADVGTGYYYMDIDGASVGDPAYKGAIQLSVFSWGQHAVNNLPPSLYTYSAEGGHTHNMQHTHGMQHNHNMEHTHSLDLHLQTNVETGIRLFEMASNVWVKVNGMTVAQNINTNVTLDVASYLLLNTDNVIEIGSATNGYIEGSLVQKIFARF